MQAIYKMASEGNFCDWDTDYTTTDENMIFTETFLQGLHEEAPDNEDDVFLGLDFDLFPFSATTSRTGQLDTPFRSSCLTHTLQLVIKDGQQALQVSLHFPMKVLLNLFYFNCVCF